MLSVLISGDSLPDSALAPPVSRQPGHGVDQVGYERGAAAPAVIGAGAEGPEACGIPTSIPGTKHTLGTRRDPAG